MSDIDKRIEDRIRAFTQELRDLLRQAAVEAITTALSSSPPANASSQPTERAAKRKRSSSPSRQTIAPAERRSPQQMARVVDLLLAQVTAQPGQTIEQIAKALGMPVRQLSRPVGKLLASGRIRKTGIKRYTRYFPADAPSSARAKKASSKHRRRSRD